MKIGEPYWESAEEGRVDQFITGLAWPIYLAARKATIASLENGVDPIYLQDRVGAGEDTELEDRLFSMEKFRTLDPDTLLHNHRLARQFRKLGVDELAQLANIKRHNMHIASYRPRILSEHKDMQSRQAPHNRSAHIRLTSLRLPGVLSSYGIYHHIHPEIDVNEPDIIAELDLKDGRYASTSYTAYLLGSFVSHAVCRRFK